MASTVMEADDSRATSKAAPPELHVGNNDLCRLCLQGLTISDQAAGGTTQERELDGKTTSTLDLAGFMNNYWKRRTPIGFRRKLAYYEDPITPRGFCAGDQHERLVTLPMMPEISESAFGTCRFCSIIRALFVEEYAEHSWWNKPGSRLRFIIQYEWCKTWPFFTVEGGSGSPLQHLDALAVLVRYPGLVSTERDVYEFDVVSWPGMTD